MSERMGQDTRTMKYLEYFGRGVPQLFSRPRLVFTVRNISLGDLLLELDRVSERPKLYVLWRSDDGRAFREIAIVGVVQRIFDVVADQHLDPPRGVFELPKVVGRDAFVVDVLGIWNIVKVDLGVEVDFLSFLGDEGRGRGGEETGESPSTLSDA